MKIKRFNNEIEDIKTLVEIINDDLDGDNNRLKILYSWDTVYIPRDYSLWF